ncbi:hypothetical protein UPYG_G00212170 [Umbra pygmaea]|uniref:Macro domain-containing protein n=1 Tax=Umbra pygmaea TaxID=75934 RepID=A0ABD0WPS2_UMBPY
MAFHMSTLSSCFKALAPLFRCADYHTTNIGSCSKFRNTFSFATRQLNSPVGQSSVNSSPAKCKGLLKPVGIQLAIRLKTFLSTTIAKSFLGLNKRLTFRSKHISLYRIALGALGMTTVAPHASPHLALAGSEKLNLDSANGDWKEVKERLLSMNLKERRENYRTATYQVIEDVPLWTPKADDSGKKLFFKRNEALDLKISLFRGDITKLEIDCIVNAANKTLLGGGGVDGAIHRTAGPLLKNECAELLGCETGEAKITGGYGLPAKYVIHTVGPIVMGAVGKEEENRLRECYRHSLEKATENKLRTVAFPCISTGVYGYPPDQAVHIALETVRKYLDEHHAKLDRVIFCVFLPSDAELYLKTLPLYFPPGLPLKNKL